VRDILILEQEDIPGYYASGRNAGMIRGLVPQPEIRRLVRRSLRFFESPPASFPGPLLFRRCGSLLLAAGRESSDLMSWVETDRGVGPEVQFLSAPDLKKWVDIASFENIDRAAFTASDGVADVHGLLQGFLAGARKGGAEIRFQTRAREVLTRNGCISGLATDSGERIECSMVVNAAGPWAARIAELAGATRIPFFAVRRHLAQTELLPWIDPAWPYVWDITHGVYFRPESGGVLLCPCDEDLLEPCDPPVDSRQIQILAEKVSHYFPGLKNVQIRRYWACLRTFAPDRGLVIGTDRNLNGFFWCAGLGGHGVGLAPALTELVPDLIIDGESPLLPDQEMRRVAPGRFLQTAGKEPLPLTNSDTSRL
jgi:D-arginine dehydrogenase